MRMALLHPETLDKALVQLQRNAFGQKRLRAERDTAAEGEFFGFLGGHEEILICSAQG